MERRANRLTSKLVCDLGINVASLRSIRVNVVNGPRYIETNVDTMVQSQCSPQACPECSSFHKVNVVRPAYYIDFGGCAPLMSHDYIDFSHSEPLTTSILWLCLLEYIGLQNLKE